MRRLRGGCLCQVRAHSACGAPSRRHCGWRSRKRSSRLSAHAAARTAAPRAPSHARSLSASASATSIGASCLIHAVCARSSAAYASPPAPAPLPLPYSLSSHPAGRIRGRQLANKIKIKIKTLNPMRYGSRGEEDLEDGGSKLLPASPSDMSTKSSSTFQAEPAP